MKATKTHISLETAKLLKDCGVESCSTWVKDYDDVKGWKVFRYGEVIGEQYDYGFFDKDNLHSWNEFYPAYTWQEILWDNNRDFLLDDDCNHILILLQQKKYEEADKYFREHCMLINNK